MINQFSIKTRIYTGLNALQILAQYTGKKVGIVTDGFMISSGLINRITDKLTHCEILIFDGVKPDPCVEVLTQGTQFFSPFLPDVIIALGGGSSLDAAKGILAALNSLSANQNISLIAIPTTSGSGSEVTSYAVISDPINNIKYPLVSDDLLADIAILDSSLVISVPKSVSVDTGMDVMTHAIEAYVSTQANDFTDALAEKSLRLVYQYLPKVHRNLSDHQARERMHNASCMAGIAFNSAGLGLVHGVAHALGALLHISHGKINAMLLPIVIEFNCQFSSEVMSRYASCAKIIGLQNNNDLILVQKFVSEIKRMNKTMGIAASLKELGSDIELLLKNKNHVIKTILNDSCIRTNPRPVNADDIQLIINKIIG